MRSQTLNHDDQIDDSHDARQDVTVIEVRVFSGDRLVALENCADQVEVAELRDRWADLDGVTFLVDEVSSTVLSTTDWE